MVPPARPVRRRRDYNPTTRSRLPAKRPALPLPAAGRGDGGRLRARRNRPRRGARSRRRARRLPGQTRNAAISSARARRRPAALFAALFKNGDALRERQRDQAELSHSPAALSSNAPATNAAPAAVRPRCRRHAARSRRMPSPTAVPSPPDRTAMPSGIPATAPGNGVHKSSASLITAPIFHAAAAKARPG